jgi:acyl-CoA thioesterase YciA
MRRLDAKQSALRRGLCLPKYCALQYEFRFIFCDLDVPVPHRNMIAHKNVCRGRTRAAIAAGIIGMEVQPMSNVHRRPNAAAEPTGELASRTLAMPADTNPLGDMFGGWIMSLMDNAGAMTAVHHARGRVVTVAVSNIAFLQPVKVGDVVCCYTDVTRLGTSSMTLTVEVWVLRQGQGDRVKVTEAEFTFVAVNDNGRPRPLPK